jgi:carboxylate-amine ligase
MRPELLRLAAWRASRSGLDGELIDPRTGRPGGAAAVTALLLAHVRDALADAGDLGPVTGLLTEVQRRGTGAAFQRGEFRRTGRLRDVVASAAEAISG